MRILHCVLILAFAILLKTVYCDSSNAHPNSPPNDQVNPFILAMQWPPGVCSEKSKNQKSKNCLINPMPTNFMIHGLWQKVNATPSNENFDSNKIHDLTLELNLTWPNLYNNTESGNREFWEYEWNRHGNYSGLGMHEYFNKTLELFNATVRGLEEKLAAKKIIPSNITTYRLTKIEAAVISITDGFNATIICVQRNDNINTQQIKEIWFNYTLDFKKMNTSSASKCNHDDEILFPAPPHSDPEILCPAPSPGFGLTEAVSVPDSTTSTTPFHLLWLVY